MLLNQEQKVQVCQVADFVGVDYIKTSTGLHPAGGVTIEDIHLIKASAPHCRIKASGGIRTVDQVLAMLEAGASRIGTSSGVAIIQECRAGESQ